jgi:iron complex outermembrane receptor protein
MHERPRLAGCKAAVAVLPIRSPQRCAGQATPAVAPATSVVAPAAPAVAPAPSLAVRHGRPWRVRRWLRVTLLAGVTGLGHSPGADAQSVDYGTMEQLFGEPVTMSVTGKPQRVADAPANIEIITQDDIRRSGATSIPDVLRFVTGVDVRQNGLADAEVGIRGYNQPSSPHLMVLVDGRQVYMVDYGRIIWAAIPVQLDEIRQIEVIKGPNSALYGFNAVSGVINIITYDPLKDRVNVATLRGGTPGYAGGSLVGTGTIDDTAGVRLSLGGFNARDFAPGPLGPQDSAARQPPFTGTFNASGRWRITPTVEAFSDMSVGDTRLAEEEPPGIYDTERLVTTAIRAGVNADTAFGLLSLSATRNDAQVRLDNISFGMPLTLGEYQTTYVAQASDLVKLGTDHTLRLGLEWRDNADDSGDLADGRISNDIYSVSLMWDWQITPNVGLTNALRLDHMVLHYSGQLIPPFGLSAAQYNRTVLNQPSLNSGLVWRATDDDTFRLSAARGVQLPSLLEYGLQVPAGFYGPLAYAGRPDLRPSIVWSTELDYDRALSAIDSTLRTALFLQRIDDVIAWPFGAPVSFTPAGMPIFYSSNVGYSIAAGGELGIKGHNTSGWRWNASYALVATADHTSLNRGALPSGVVTDANSTPEHVVLLGVGYSWERLEADLLTRWQSDFLDFRLTPDRSALTRVTIDNYVTMDARIGYRVLDNVTAAFSVQQLNAPHLVESAGPPMERRVIVSITVRL